MPFFTRHTVRFVLLITFAISIGLATMASVAPSAFAQSAVTGAAASSSTVVPAPLPKDYVIGVQDVLIVVFWNAKEMSADVVVRPDGKISLPLLNDIAAAGMKPEELALAITKDAAKFVKDPVATVIVKEIHSRKVYVVGEVAKPGSFLLVGDMTVLQAIAEAGGFLEGAKKSDVTIVRHENGKEQRYKFSYNDFVRGKNIQRNIALVPGDIVLIR